MCKCEVYAFTACFRETRVRVSRVRVGREGMVN